MQAALGLLIPGRYRDVEWIAATWWGNDLVTLGLAVPLLCFGWTRAVHGSTRGLLLWLGVLAYGVYNYAYYLFGAALNVFFPLYLFAVLLFQLALIALVQHIAPMHVTALFRATTPVRVVGAYFVFVGAGLAAVWMAMWAAYVFGGRPTPIEPEAFKLVAALDTVLMVPALVTSGALLRRRQPWGYVIACAAGVQASLYLTVLAVNSAVLVARGLVAPPGELAIWGTLAASMVGMTLVLFTNITETREA